MKDYVNEYLAAKKTRPDYPVVPPMYFKRGGHMSVQGSSGHYCSPKTDPVPTAWSKCWSRRRASRCLRALVSHNATTTARTSRACSHGCRSMLSTLRLRVVEGSHK